MKPLGVSQYSKIALYSTMLEQISLTIALLAEQSTPNKP